MRMLRRSLPALVAVSVLVTGCGYNTIQTKDEAVNSAGAQIKAQLQRRADLIPNLVETVKGFAKQETTIFTEVAETRGRLSGAVQSGRSPEMAQANQALNAPLGRLLAIVETYPDLKSKRELSAAAGSARGHREPDLGGAPGLQQGRGRLQQLYPAVSVQSDGEGRRAVDAAGVLRAATPEAGKAPTVKF